MDRNSVIKEYLTTAIDGKNYLTGFYNLDLINSRHSQNVFDEGELSSDSVVAFFATTAVDGAVSG